jgi:hypothetical protein
MIRDPSDGSVRQSEQICTETKVNAHPTSGPVIDPTTSGLPAAGARDADRHKRSKEWLAGYRAGKFKQTDGEG